LVWLMPLAFLVITSVKSPEDLIRIPAFAFPDKIRWQNFVDGWNRAGLSIYLKNTIFISIIKVPLGIFIEALAAFALTRLYFKRSNQIFMILLIGMMIPVQVTLIPLNQMMTELKLGNTYFGIIFIYLAFGFSFGLLVLRGFMKSIPKELDESAKIDGCSNFRLFTSIILPLIKPAVASLLILDFLGTWNELLLSSIFLNANEKRMVSYGLMTFFGQFDVDYTLLCASVLMSIVPIMGVYLYFQKYFVKGMAGSVKG
jgi:raffinose/stachyose/melibiose transport system permease protein